MRRSTGNEWWLPSVIVGESARRPSGLAFPVNSVQYRQLGVRPIRHCEAG